MTYWLIYVDEYSLSHYALFSFLVSILYFMSKQFLPSKNLKLYSRSVLDGLNIMTKI